MLKNVKVKSGPMENQDKILFGGEQTKETRFTIRKLKQNLLRKIKSNSGVTFLNLHLIFHCIHGLFVEYNYLCVQC